ncbi:MAG: hypothetical protein A2Y29_07265 [Spirochaetes bacterium GWE2_31_10]|nr:MAG: hypothetical protein A2Y29_07265 [Spirochaetes bacterium GWE2_31_10]
MEDFLRELDMQKITKVYNGNDALSLFKSNNFDLVICDVNLPDISGIELVKKMKRLQYIPQIILISGREDLEKSINAIDLGILDFLLKPINTEILSDLIHEAKTAKDKKILQLNSDFINIYKAENPDNYYYYTENKCIVTSSQIIINIIKKLKKLREYPEIPVLIEGKSGVGKELIAEFIHYYNRTQESPYIAVNCGSFVETIFESELFGYEKGAFTGANTTGKEGKIKLAETGSLFLDEITEISMEMQTKLLRVLQEKEYYKVGSNIKQGINTRIICATNKYIPKLINNKLFREDLYYRLNICKLTIPTLAERPEDILPLIIFFMKEFNEKSNFKIVEISKEAVDYLVEYQWPGNIRELKNAITKALLFNEKKYLSINDFVFLKNATHKKKITKDVNLHQPVVIDPMNFVLPTTPFNLEKLNELIVKETMKKFNGNKSLTAKFLGLNRMQMYHKYKNNTPQ